MNLLYSNTWKIAGFFIQMKNVIPISLSEEFDCEDEWDEDEESAPFDYSELHYFVAIPNQIQQEA